MAKSSETFNKKEKEKKRLEKQKAKEQRKEERKANKESKSFEDMIAYVDENGNFSSTPPDLTKKRAIKESDISLSSKNKGGAASADTVRQGVIKFFEQGKGYGFIKDSQTQEEFFFHYSSANFQVAQSQAVTFEIEQGPKGMNAVRINKVG